MNNQNIFRSSGLSESSQDLINKTSKPNRSFWKKRKVFLTGHTGFKGSWLSLWLNALGADVIGYALDPPTQPNLFNQASVSDVVHSIYGDIRDFSKLKSALAGCQADVVIHMAAQTVVRFGYENPIETYSSNVMGTVNLLESLRILGKPCAVVIVTSDKCYENKEWIWGYRENDIIGGHDPYSNSKACAELVTSAYRDSFFCTNGINKYGIAVASARAGNVIGGGDWTTDQLLPDLMRAFLSDRPCLIRNPSSIRPWQFVLEALRGYLVLAERLFEDSTRFASAWNFGPSVEDSMPVSWIANEVAELWGHGALWSRDVEKSSEETHLLILDSSKAKRYLNWYPLIPLKVALDLVVEWYRTFKSGGDLKSLTRMQIKRYEEL